MKFKQCSVKFTLCAAVCRVHVTHAGAVMSYGYSFLAIGLGASQAWRLQGTLAGRPAAPGVKLFGIFNALGNFGL